MGKTKFKIGDSVKIFGVDVIPNGTVGKITHAYEKEQFKIEHELGCGSFHASELFKIRSKSLTP